MAKGKFVSPHSQCRIVIGSSCRFSCVFFFLSLAFSLFIGCLCHSTSPNILSVCPLAPGSVFASTQGHFVMPQWLHNDIFSQCIFPFIESSPASFNFMKMVVRSHSLVGNFLSSCIVICMSTSLRFLLVCIKDTSFCSCVSAGIHWMWTSCWSHCPLSSQVYLIHVTSYACVPFISSGSVSVSAGEMMRHGDILICTVSCFMGHFSWSSSCLQL